MKKSFLTIFVAFMFQYVVLAQSPVSINSIQKISNSSGGLGNILGNSSNFGNRSTNMGDLDLDGVLDLAIGEDYHDDGNTNNGAVHILFMNSDGTVKTRQKISQNSGNLGLTLGYETHFGISVANIGDLDGDGIQDLAVGSTMLNNYSGKVWILFMKRDGTVKSTTTIDKNTPNFTTLDDIDEFGTDISGGGDIDNDGVNDIVVSAIGDDDGGTNRGAIYIIFLSSNGSVKGYKKISSASTGFTGALDNTDYFGSSVHLAPDLDNNGIKDLMIGAFLDDDGATNSGAVYIIKLNTDQSIKNYSKISNSVLNNINGNNFYFGRSVTSTADKDGDGITDLLVTAHGSSVNGADRGSFFLIYLTSTQTVKSYQVFNSATPALSPYLDNGDRFGTSIHSLDGFANGKQHAISVMSIFDDDGATDAGAAYIITLNTPPKKKIYPDLEITNILFANDSLCADSTVVANVTVKNNGNEAVSNPKLYFNITSVDTTLYQEYTYIGKVDTGKTKSFIVTLNLINGGKTTITANSAYPKDTITNNDTFVSNIEIIKLSAEFSASDGCSGKNISFTNLSSFVGTNSVTYEWYFGDGGFSNVMNPTHSYANSGTYNVKLKISGSDCSDSFVKTVKINANPFINFTTSVPCVGTAINFNDSLNLFGQSLALISWDFGDQTSATGTSPIHAYSAAGMYSVKVKVITTNGCEAQITKSIVVSAAPLTGYTRRNDTLFAKDPAAYQYKWFLNGSEIGGETNNYIKIATEGNYTVLVTNNAGCKDSAYSNYEYTKRYLKGIVRQSNNQPLKFSMVVMAKMKLNDSTVESIDTTFTDANGEYNFITDETSVKLYAVPTINLYPNEIRGYYSAGMTIQDAADLSLKYGANSADFNTVSRVQLFGSKYVNGALINCMTCADAGNGAEDITLLLMNSNNQPILRFETGADGKFILPLLTAGTYKLWADKLFINNSVAPAINLDSATHSSAVKVTLHRTLLTIDQVVSTGDEFDFKNTSSVYPNPTNGILNISLYGNVSKKAFYTISALDGKIISTGLLKANEILQTDISSLPAGMYIVKTVSDADTQIFKIIKN